MLGFGRAHLDEDWISFGFVRLAAFAFGEQQQDQRKRQAACELDASRFDGFVSPEEDLSRGVDRRRGLRFQ